MRSPRPRGPAPRTSDVGRGRGPSSLARAGAVRGEPPGEAAADLPAAALGFKVPAALPAPARPCLWVRRPRRVRGRARPPRAARGRRLRLPPPCKSARRTCLKRKGRKGAHLAPKRPRGLCSRSRPRVCTARRRGRGQSRSRDGGDPGSQSPAPSVPAPGTQDPRVPGSQRPGWAASARLLCAGEAPGWGLGTGTQAEPRFGKWGDVPTGTRI